MDVLLIVSGVVNVFLLVLFCGALFYLNRAGKALNDYEEFYEQSVSEIERQMVYVQNIMRTNEILVHDEDARRMYKATQAIYESLIAYRIAGKASKSNQ